MPSGLSHKAIAIIVATVVGGFALLFAVAACWCMKRRKLKKQNPRFLNVKLHGGGGGGGGGDGEEAQEVVEFMKSGSFDTTPPGRSEDSGAQPSELGYTTRAWHEVPRTLQPGVANTALPAYTPGITYLPKIELADTSIIELLPTKSGHKRKPSTQLNFSRPSREHFRLNTSRDNLDMKTHAASEKCPASILKDADAEPDSPNRVSSPTIPTLRQHFEDNSTGSEGRPSSPSSSSTVRGSVSVDKDKPGRVSVASEGSTVKSADSRLSNVCWGLDKA